jgi:hypothetical protein
MPVKTKRAVEILNPRTGRRMNIDADIHEVVSKAIYHTLKQSKTGISYTDMVKGVKKCLKENKTKFKGSIGWYTVGIKNDMEANGVIEAYFEKGKKLNKLKK